MWTAESFAKHNKSLSPAQLKTAAKIANDTLARCLKGGGSQSKCEAMGVRVANGVMKKKNMDTERKSRIFLSTQEGSPCIFEGDLFKVESIHEGTWIHPNTGQIIPVDQARLEDWVANTKAWLNYKRDVPVTRGHKPDDPMMGIGFVKGIEIGDSVVAPGKKAIWNVADITDKEAIQKLDDKTIKAVSPGISLLEHAGDDGKNVVVGEGFDHLAATLRGVIAGQEQGFVRMSIDGKETECDVLLPVDEDIANLLTALEAEDEKYELAVWTQKYVNSLKDSCFLFIEPGGTKDKEGKTVPRSLRHFPVYDDGGKVDVPHLRNALARIPQSNVPDAAKKTALAKAKRLASKYLKSSKMAFAVGDMAGKMKEKMAANKPGMLVNILTDELYGCINEMMSPDADKEECMQEMKDLVDEFKGLLGKNRVTMAIEEDATTVTSTLSANISTSTNAIPPLDTVTSTSYTAPMNETKNTEVALDKGKTGPEQNKEFVMDLKNVAEKFGLAADGLTNENVVTKLAEKFEADKVAAVATAVTAAVEKAKADVKPAAAPAPVKLDEIPEYKALMEQNKTIKTELAKVRTASIAGRMKTVQEAGIPKEQTDKMLAGFSLEFDPAKVELDKFDSAVEKIELQLSLTEGLLASGVVGRKRVALALSPEPTQTEPEKGREVEVRERLKTAGLGNFDPDNQVYDPATGRYKVKSA